jgi:hypothetical protein
VTSSVSVPFVAVTTSPGRMSGVKLFQQDPGSGGVVVASWLTSRPGPSGVITTGPRAVPIVTPLRTTLTVSASPTSQPNAPTMSMLWNTVMLRPGPTVPVTVASADTALNAGTANIAAAPSTTAPRDFLRPTRAVPRPCPLPPTVPIRIPIPIPIRNPNPRRVWLHAPGPT